MNESKRFMCFDIVFDEIFLPGSRVPSISSMFFIQTKWSANVGCRMWQNDDMPFRISNGRAAMCQCGAWHLKLKNPESHGIF